MPCSMSLLFFSPFTFRDGYVQINAAAEVIYDSVDPNANIIFGSLIDESMQGEVAITVIATGFPASLNEPLSGSASTVSGSSAKVTVAAPRTPSIAAVVEKPQPDIDVSCNSLYLFVGCHSIYS